MSDQLIVELLKPLYWLLSLFPFDVMKAHFMQRAILTMLLLSPVCAVMGTLVVQFRMAFFSDAIAHSAFTGIALGLLLNIDPRFAMPIFAIITGIMTMRLKRAGDLAMDTTLGVVFSATIALGLAIISAKKCLAKSLPGFLYGDVLAISDGELVWMLLLAVVVWVFLLVWYNRLLFMSLHTPLARVHGIPVERLEIVFATLLSLTVAFSIRAVGILLVTALLVIPAATARRLGRSAGSQVWWAISIAIFSSIAGLATSVSYDTAAGAAMILWSVAAFGISLWLPAS
ncbi:MAG: metal ABC transporter permease [Candidatus Riflebacteria bacterium]|nr:metal ABC transporter permease [Candidatus Riflebacteria bacterium]